MLKQITLFRRTGRGRNAEVFDVLELLGQTQYGSAANATLVCVRDSAVFKAAQDQLRSGKPETDRPSKRRKAAS